MINFAILGAGAIARIHVESLLKLKDRCRITAICDRDLERARKLNDEFKLKCKIFSDMDELFASGLADAASICLPPGLHCACACKALNAGVNVIVEKPMAMSPSQCDLMINAAKAKNLQLAVICQNRWKTGYYRLKKIIDSGILGRIFQVSVNSLWWRGNNYYDLWWRGTWKVEGGGCLMSHGVHHLDLLLWMFGMPSSVRATLRNLAHNNSECEDLVNAELWYANNMQINLTVSLLNHGEEQSIIVQSEKAKLGIPFTLYCSKALENGFPSQDSDNFEKLSKIYNNLPKLPLEGHEAQLNHFINAIEGKETLTSTGECGKAVLELAMGIYKSGVTHCEVSLPLDRTDPFYTHEGLVAHMPHFHEKTRSVTNFKETKITLGRDVGN